MAEINAVLADMSSSERQLSAERAMRKRLKVNAALFPPQLLAEYRSKGRSECAGLERDEETADGSDAREPIYRRTRTTAEESQQRLRAREIRASGKSGRQRRHQSATDDADGGRGEGERVRR